mgnify:CR=1 FL=1|tara:strand:- start:82 stop:801 length:720 start_codon:yes stop_codon:yes gene_type:complete
MQEQPPLQPRILLAEDDLALRRMLKLNFEKEGWFVLEAANGEESLRLARQNRVDAAVLDVMMPKLDGLSVCKSLRLEGLEIPILFLTAKNQIEDRVEGLRIGADDYLGKPFHLEELLLRVRNLIRLGQGKDRRLASARFEFSSDCWIDFSTYTIRTRVGEERNISKREAMLLRLLTSKAGEVVSREEILEVVWGYSAFPSTRTIDNYILAFRKYFEPDPKVPQHFLSTRGIGYRFQTEK